ncbi:MAG TPA: efflux RND transporter periplasmic adaptor subunit [Chloroflexota bacterium]|jgi:HlyD family secretion protein|nr:efflux RND transporter periplasmic adaptor subunit [Chloroflexota bacterium]
MEAANPPIQAATATKKGFGWLTAGLIALALVIVAAVAYLAYDRYLARPLVQPLAGTPVAVRRGSVAATVAATGSVVPSRQSKLTLPSSGRLKEITVKLGDEVKGGQVLARQETAALDLKLAQAKSSLRTAELKLAQLKAGARPEEVVAAEAGVQSAQAKVADLEGGALPQDVVQAQSAVEQAAAGIRQAAARRDQVRAGATHADVTAAEQGVQSATSSLQKAEIDLAKAQGGATADELRQAELALEQAKNSLWAQQISRDATCSRPSGGQCEAEKARVAAAETGVTQAQAKLDAVKAKPDPKDVQAAQAQVDAARETLRAAQAKLAQLKGGPAAEEVRQADAQVESAVASQQAALAKLEAVRQGPKSAEVQAARSALVQAQTQLAVKKTPSLPQEIALAEEAIRAAELQVQQAQLDLDNAALIAPFDGVVGAISANAGEQVGGGTAVLTLVDPKATRVDVSVDETDIARLAPGKPATITFDALPEKRFTGKVLGIAPSATVQQGVATYTVAVSIDDADQPLPAGMTANVSIVVAQKENVVLVPNRAIKRVGRNQVVDVLTGQKAEPRQIKTGLGNEQFTEVVEGVAEGETVVIPATTTQAPRVGPFGAGGPPPGAPGPVFVAKPAAKP